MEAASGQQTTQADAKDGALLARVFEARAAATDRLVEQRGPDGNWAVPIDLYAFLPATYIIMLRTTGLTGRPGSPHTESLLVRHMIHQVNPDGGFYKFPGSPSSRSVTGVALVALRLALGEVAPGSRPPAWFRRNPEIDEALERSVRGTIAHAEWFLRRGRTRAGLAFELDHKLLEKLLIAQADCSRLMLPVPWLCPGVGAWVIRSRWLSKAAVQFNYLLRKMLPAISILYGRVRERNWLWATLLCALRRSDSYRRYRQAAVEHLARHIRDGHNECGGWLFNTFYTMLNIMALREAGTALDDPAIVRAHDHLLQSIFPAGDGGTFIDIMSNDMWNTSHGVYSYLRIPGHRATDETIRPSVEFLLQWQGADGGYAWGSGSRNDREADTTAFVLRPLALAARTAGAKVRARIMRAVRRGMTYLIPRQDKRGGFSVWHSTFVECMSGSSGPTRHILFDVASVDVTARIVETLAELGLTTKDEPVRKALRFLLSTQCRNGAWWCRWWAGYIIGAGHVLRVYGKLGLRYGSELATDEKLLARSHRALRKGVHFLLQHQNADGGWGETIRSDSDSRQAGRGESTPLHTAFTLSALLTCGYPARELAIRRGVEYLLSTMTPDGRWNDLQATFTFVPRTFYYPYAFVNYILPLDALTDYLQAVGAEERVGHNDISLARVAAATP